MKNIIRVWVGLWLGLLLNLGGLAAAQNMDQFANALDLSDRVLTYTGYYGTAATAEPGEPAHAGSPAAHSVWFQYAAPADGVYAFGEWTNGSSARIAIYTGSAVTALTRVAQGVTRVVFKMQAGVRYHIALDTEGPDVYFLRAYPTGGADEMADALAIPADLPQRVHGNNMLATRSPTDEDLRPPYAPQYTVWWRWTAPATGAVRLDGRDSDFGPMVDVYEQVPGGTQIKKNTGLQTFGMLVTAGYQYWFRFDQFMDYGPGEINFWLEWMPTTPPPNDNIAAAIDLGNAPVACDGGWIFFATPEAGLPQEYMGLPQYGIPGDRTIWWKWTCPRSGHYRFSPRGSDWAPELLVYTGTPPAISIITGLQDPDGVRIQATAGVQYWVKLRDGQFRCTRSELNIHPAETETAYFKELDNRAMFRLQGAQRHPDADPDGDGICNQIELAFFTRPDSADFDNPRLPRLVSAGTGLWKLRWSPYSSYLTSPQGADLKLEAQTTSDLSGPWQTPPRLTEGTDIYSVMLPSGPRGFARLSLTDPNLALPP
ncbi:MAG: hypothetical protein V4819_20185 [Verrucomicrobiota bacterium]